MNIQKSLIAFIATAILFSACNQYDKQSSNPHAATSAIEVATELTDRNRAIIKTAELTLQVDNVPEKIKEIQLVVNSMNGHVMHYEMNSNKHFQKEVEYNLDSSYVINEINPEGVMKIKIPSPQADTFIQAMLSMHVDIDKLMFDENDVTEDLHEKKELVQTNASVKRNAAQLKQQVYADEQPELTIQRKAQCAKLKYQTNFLWFDIYLNGHSYIEKNKTVSAKNIHIPFYVSVCNALESGWYAFSLFLVALMNIWPFILVAALLIIAYKRKWFKRVFIR